MVRWHRCFTGIVLLLLISAGPAWGVGVGDAAPDFSLTTLEGTPAGLADYKGKQPLMLVFWATWCPICKREIPQVNRIVEEFGPRGLAVLAVNVGVNDSAGKVMAFRDRFGMAYPVAFDEDSTVTRAFGVLGTPTVLIVDRNGIVRYRNAAVPEDLEQQFARLQE